MHRLSSNMLAVCLLLLVCSCADNDTLLHSYQKVDECSWAKGDTLKFILPASAEDQDVDVQVEIRTNSRYPFQTLWLNVDHNLANHDTFVKQRLKCKILEENGDIIGNGSAVIQYSFPLGTFHVHKCHAATIKVSHYMKSEQLQGIQDVGIRINALHRYD